MVCKAKPKPRKPIVWNGVVTSQAELARTFGVSRERIRQVYDAFDGDQVEIAAFLQRDD